VPPLAHLRTPLHAPLSAQDDFRRQIQHGPPLALAASQEEKMRLGAWIGCGVLAMASLGVQTAAAQTTGLETVRCPDVGVPSKVDPVLVKGRVICHYIKGTDVLTTRNIGSKSGAAFQSCLRNRSDDSRMFCSTSISQAERGASAYTWAPWSGDNKKYARAKLGWAQKRNASRTDLYPCRFKHDGHLRMGYDQDGLCVAASGKSSVSTASFDSFLLTKEYGNLTTHKRYGTAVHITPGSIPGLAPPALCTVVVQPAPPGPSRAGGAPASTRRVTGFLRPLLP
jgi:hypothetical protein